LEDYSRGARPLKSAWLRALLMIAGSLALALGVIGIFLPLLPTTPFLLLAAACYARSSTRFYNWLLGNRFFGAYIRLWRDEGRVPRRAKITAVALIVVTLGAAIVWFVPLLPVKLLLAAIGLAVIVYLLRLPSA